jgi:hypothetical protein
MAWFFIALPLVVGAVALIAGFRTREMYPNLAGRVMALGALAIIATGMVWYAAATRR